jgi:hypothetical protein
MRSFRFALAPLLVLAPFAVACSSSSDGSKSSGNVVDPATHPELASYCVGTLSVDEPLLAAANGTSWISDGTHVAAGTKFFLGYEFGAWSGYVLRADGRPAQIDSFKGLVRGTDFSGDCTVPSSWPSQTVLGSATLYGAKDLSGPSCVLDSGTVLPDYSILGDGNGDGVEVDSSVIKAKCGFDKAYAKDFHSAPLVSK